jgi:hypothetical protein
LKSGIKSGVTAATSFSRKRLVWESVWVDSAARSFRIFDTVDQWATGFFVKGWLHVLLVDSTSGDEQVEYFQNEDTFDLAGTVGAESRVDVVKTVAVEGQVDFSGTSTWQVLDFPRNARVVTKGFFEVEHAAIVTVSKFLAKVIDSVDWLSVASSVVVLEVTPASVLVDSVEVIAGQDIGDGSWLGSVGFDERSNVSLGEVAHLFFHGLETGIGVAGEEDCGV